MTVLPCPSESLRYNLALQELFFDTHQQVQQTQSSQILSFSQTLDQSLNLRAVLQAHLHKKQHYCYWENPQHHTAILGLGQVIQATLQPDNRFGQAQHLTQQWFARLHQGGVTQRPYAGASCFAAFTFFAQSGHEPAIFAPGTLFIPQVQLVSQPEGGLWVANLLIEPSSTLEETIARLEVLDQQIQSFKTSRTGERSPAQSQPLVVPLSPHHPFIQAVQTALQDIDQQQLTKIVLAHAVDSLQPQTIPIGQTLNQLRHTHPDCYVFAFGNGSGYHFVGASPERLIAIHDQILTTDALAGSAPRGGTPERDRAIAQYLLASEKESREHQAVSDYIVQRLLALGLQPQCLSRRLRHLSNIQHLWTPITAPLPANLHPLQVVGQLHPTPAVAGMPADLACTKIRQYEAFDRALYAAPLGWLNAQGESEFIVGIRSALIRDNWVRLYGGAGIVSGSDPERELAEIQLKLQTMRQAIV